VPNVVTGISQDGNVDALTRALQAAKLSLDPLQVLDAGAPAPTLPATRLVDTSLLTGSGLDTGTGVPGLTGRGLPGIGETRQPEIDGDSIWVRLSDFEIPDDELENYALALEAGRSVVAYAAGAATVRAVETAFRASGLVNVKTF
jgi:hypothetical protein